MISLPALQEKYAAFYRAAGAENIKAQLLAHGYTADQADRVIDQFVAETSRAVAPVALEQLPERLRQHGSVDDLEIRWAAT
jgi:hypothetical protein